MAGTEIRSITARQVYTNRGNPGVEAVVTTENGATGRAMCTSGISIGTHEIHFDFDGGERFRGKGVLGADMEKAALFTIGRLRGMKTASILNNVVLYGEDTADSIGDYAGGESATARGERLEILTALEAFALLEKREKA